MIKFVLYKDSEEYKHFKGKQAMVIFKAPFKVNFMQTL